MGRLFWKNSNDHIHMRTALLLGRSGNCDVRINSPKVSNQHATMLWLDDGWEVRDLGSRNGTFINGRRLGSGERMSVGKGATISLAREVADFELVDASAPGAIAINQETGLSCFAEGGILALPHDHNPLTTIFMTSEGEWLIENGNTQRRITDGECIEIHGTRYRLELPGSETETLQSGMGVPTLASIALRFGVTPDEEQVELTVIIAGRAQQLPARRFHYLLVTLARAWLAEEGVSPSVRGWVDRDELCRGLDMDATKLGVEIYRARKQLAALGIQGAAGLIERRAGTYEIRIGVPNVQVVML